MIELGKKSHIPCLNTLLITDIMSVFTDRAESVLEVRFKKPVENILRLDVDTVPAAYTLLLNCKQEIPIENVQKRNNYVLQVAMRCIVESDNYPVFIGAV